jgi:hypothetical protein
VVVEVFFSSHVEVDEGLGAYEVEEDLGASQDEVVEGFSGAAEVVLTSALAAGDEDEGAT